MVSRVKVKMNICGKEHIIIVDTIGKNNFSLVVESDCPNVLAFMKGLNRITMDDLVEKYTSRIFDRMRNSQMSATCLVPHGILSAGWMEAGLWSKNLAMSQERNTIEFEE
ncbi:MAG: hypothetical protein GKC03_02500 [Methanomassiliicoccales archaeon]|nr:hypothetical protein [Methanomassiliicoccales archaeon]NYT14924.1 hypothetical protein [Methanomassiliicoccales archaeon]